jgi:hypothetical protein
MGLFANVFFSILVAYTKVLVFIQLFIVDKSGRQIRISRARVLQKKGQVRVNAGYR